MLVRHRRHHRRRRSHQSSAIISIAGDGRDRKQRNRGYDNCRRYDPEIDHLVFFRQHALGDAVGFRGRRQPIEIGLHLGVALNLSVAESDYRTRHGFNAGRHYRRTLG
jgi:hypothetical protein